MTTKAKLQSPSELLAEPRTFVARLIVAELISKRGQGPLQPKRLVYRPRKS